jgi:alkanesulfonate monooxygenase SsuD/methylene tetrahydromethanopterin reductase-like flavin-dependent oxidoreductase (luciferase family)
MLAPGVSTDDVIDAEYLARNVWIVGSPETARDRLRETQRASGGFGTLLVHVPDFHDDSEPFRRHLELLGREVIPALQEAPSPA